VTAAKAPPLADLGEVGPGGESVFGGKAHGLFRLLAAGARVPSGFAIGASVAPPEAWDPERLAELGRRGDLLLREGPVAVRSSALGEDGTRRSFAGMLETVLGVSDREGLLRSVARVAASGGSERARAYAGGAAPLAVGVVVQAQVAARAAGVCFTVDPSGRHPAVVIEAVPGLGEALVSGHAQPEGWRVHRDGRGRDDARRVSPSAAPVLDEAEALAIARQARDLADRLGHPLDLEWALDGSGLWWLQARPVTAATPLREPEVERYFDGVHDGPITLWSNWNVREVMPEPMTPLAWSLWRDSVIPVIVEPLFGVPRTSPLFRHVVPTDLVEGRLYWNMNGLLASPFSRKFIRRSLHHMDPEAAGILDTLVESGVVEARRLPGSWRLLLGGLGASLGAVGGLLGAARPRRAMRSLRECAADLRARPAPAGLGDQELIAEMQLLAEPPARRLRETAHLLGLSMIVFMSAERAFRAHPEARRLLTAGISGNPTTEISIGIDALAAAARPVAGLFAEDLESGALLTRLGQSDEGRQWLGALDAFLDRHGQRCPGEFDLARPRWSEDPGMILALVRARLASPASEGVAERLERLAGQRRRAVAAALSAAPAWRRPWMRYLAWLVAEYMPMREAPKHYTMVCYQRMRASVLEAGRRLGERGVIETPDDVFFLTMAEVRTVFRDGSLASLRETLSARRQSHARHLAVRPPGHLRSDGVPVADGRPVREGALSGIGASGGRASGPVRILRSPDPAAMAVGDVIVVEFADPGWTPLFPRAGALVMEVGGAMCHAAVVAREVGIPAVFGVAGATTALRDGQVVTVDGDLGTVDAV
jgi:phosphohistidine swiveling domain-containing protein